MLIAISIRQQAAPLWQMGWLIMKAFKLLREGLIHMQNGLRRLGAAICHSNPVARSMLWCLSQAATAYEAAILMVLALVTLLARTCDCQGSQNH